MTDIHHERRVCAFCGDHSGFHLMIVGMTASICHSCVRDFIRFVKGSQTDSALPDRGEKSSCQPVYDARAQAKRIIQEAERDAMDVRRRALQKFQLLREEARRKGYEDGLAEGRAGRSSA